MEKEARTEELRDRYKQPGFYPSREVRVDEDDAGARIIHLSRRSKKQFAASVAQGIAVGTIVAADMCAIYRAVMPEYSLSLMCGE